MVEQTQAQRLADLLETDGWPDAAAELRRLEAVNAQLLEALKLALRSHGVMLLSDPPQDAWKAYGVEAKARAAIEQAEKPVAWVNRGENRITRVAGWDGYGALYTTPPAAQWVGLDREIAIAVLNHCYGHTVISADMIDRTTEVIKAKLKENT